MRSIGIRELKARTSQVIREVRLHGGEVDITHHGRVVARLVPVAAPRPVSRRSAAVWSTIDRVAREIGRRWPKGVSAVQAVREGRRDL
jgi:prevent-host-death family protein